MLSYLTAPLRRLFSNRNEASDRNVIPLDSENGEPRRKRLCLRAPLKPTNSAPESSSFIQLGPSSIGHSVQDWFYKIGEMAAKPVMNFSISHSSTDPVEEYYYETDDDEEAEEEPVEMKPEIKGRMSSTQSLTREPLHHSAVPQWKVISNKGDLEHLWNGKKWNEAAEFAKEIVSTPEASIIKSRTVQNSKKNRALQGSDTQSDKSSQSTGFSVFKKYQPRMKSSKKRSALLEPIRLDEREQYRMLLKQHCKQDSYADLSTFSIKNKSLSHSFLRDTRERESFNVEKLSDTSRRDFIERLHVVPDRKSMLPKTWDSQKENLVRPGSFYVPSDLPSTSLSLPKTGKVTTLRGSRLHERDSFRKSSPKTDESRLFKYKSYQDLRETRTETRAKCDTTSRVPPLGKRLSLPTSDKSFFSQEWLNDLKMSLDDSFKTKAKEKEILEKRTKSLQEKREAKVFSENRKSILRIRKSLNLKSADASEEEEEAMPELTSEMMQSIDDALRPTPGEEVLCEGFRLSIARRDMETLSGLNWLNDEIINFYMNLLMERGKNDNFPSVYAFNTFFYPKLISGGHNALRRWTRQVDIFSYHYVLIPVHLGMHWCLAVIDFKQKKIQYYDSMGGQNNECVNALRIYLQDESKDKKKVEYDISDWKLETVKNIPQQMNGSDCGMFTLKYAEYITRNAKITFSQRHMPYFRRRMVYEIIKKRLL